MARPSRTAGAARMQAAGEGAAVLSAAGAAHPLRLVRSYRIPAGDPSAARLANWSWTYDSAVTAIAFTATGDRHDAATLLDQLAALQTPGGSIATAFDVLTGESSGVVRSGTVAWVGLAAAAYDHRFKSTRYGAVAERAAADLLALRSSDGLVQGGTDVTWISTQNNLLAYALFTRLGRDLRSSHPASAARDASAARTIAAGVTTGLMSTTGGAHFIEGAGDTVLPLDVQSLGAMFLRSRGQTGLARQVVAFANARFAVSGRSIVRSSAVPRTTRPTPPPARSRASGRSPARARPTCSSSRAARKCWRPSPPSAPRPRAWPRACAAGRSSHRAAVTRP